MPVPVWRASFSTQTSDANYRLPPPLDSTTETNTPIEIGRRFIPDLQLSNINAYLLRPFPRKFFYRLPEEFTDRRSKC